MAGWIMAWDCTKLFPHGWAGSSSNLPVAFIRKAGWCLILRLGTSCLNVDASSTEVLRAVHFPHEKQYWEWGSEEMNGHLYSPHMRLVIGDLHDIGYVSPCLTTALTHDAST